MDQPGNHILVRGNQTGAADRMRELLARTVQDHVADQRSNAGALVPLYAQDRYGISSISSGSLLIARAKGLKVKVSVLEKVYETGLKCAAGFKETMKIVFDKLLPKWNYRAVPEPV